MASYIKTFVRDWNPARNRRLLLQKEVALANCQNGWGNTHYKLLEADKAFRLLERSRNHWRDIAGHLATETNHKCGQCNEILDRVRRDEPH